MVNADQFVLIDPADSSDRGSVGASRPVSTYQGLPEEYIRTHEERGEVTDDVFNGGQDSRYSGGGSIYVTAIALPGHDVPDIACPIAEPNCGGLLQKPSIDLTGG